MYEKVPNRVCPVNPSYTKVEKFLASVTSVTYGEIIRAARRAYPMTQRDLARRMKLSTATVSRWENDVQPPLYSHIERLCPLLGIPIDALLEAIGLRVSPRPESSLYPPLADLLAHRSLREQRALYDFLHTATQDKE